MKAADGHGTIRKKKRKTQDKIDACWDLNMVELENKMAQSRITGYDGEEPSMTIVGPLITRQAGGKYEEHDVQNVMQLFIRDYFTGMAD